MKLSPQELGASTPGPMPVGDQGLPPAGRKWAVPHAFTFSGLQNTSAHTYDTQFDVALRASRENSWRMRLDPMITGCLDVRTTPTALLAFSVKPQDDEDPQQVAAAKRQEKLLQRLPRMVEFRRGLLKEGLFVGRSGAMLVYSWAYDKKLNRNQCYPAGYTLLNGDKLQFKWDGRVGIAVNSTSEQARSPNTEVVNSFPCYFPDHNERQGVVVHRSFSEDADFYRPWLAGSINGVGLRSSLYWTWALKSQLWGMSIDFLRWFAKGMSVYFYEHGNQAHFDAVRTAVQTQDGNTAMLYPTFPGRVEGDGKPYYPEPFKHIEVSKASPQFLQELITNYLDDLIRFAILHQSLTTTAAATGLGSGVADSHQTTFDQLVKLDATMLDETMTQEILAVMYATNEPGVPCGKVVSQVDSPNVGQLIEAATAIVSMGGTVPAQPILDAAGIPAGKSGDTLLGAVQPGQPAAVGAVPDEMPMQASADDPNQPPVG